MNRYTFSKTFTKVEMAKQKMLQMAQYLRTNNMPNAAASLNRDDKTVSFTIAGNVSAAALKNRIGSMWDVTPVAGSEPLPRTLSV